MSEGPVDQTLRSLGCASPVRASADAPQPVLVLGATQISRPSPPVICSAASANRCWPVFFNFTAGSAAMSDRVHIVASGVGIGGVRRQLELHPFHVASLRFLQCLAGQRRMRPAMPVTSASTGLSRGGKDWHRLPRSPAGATLVLPRVASARLADPGFPCRPIASRRQLRVRIGRPLQQLPLGPTALQRKLLRGPPESQSSLQRSPASALNRAPSTTSSHHHKARLRARGFCLRHLRRRLRHGTTPLPCPRYRTEEPRVRQPHPPLTLASCRRAVKLAPPPPPPVDKQPPRTFARLFQTHVCIYPIDFWQRQTLT